MQLDRRRLVAAGIGISGLAATAASTASVAQERRSPNPPRADTQSSAAEIRPNSGEDETTRLQAAIDRAASRGQSLLLPPGRFIVRGLKLPPGTRTTGSRQASISAATRS